MSSSRQRRRLETEARVEERAVDDVAVDVPRAGRQRERHTFDAFGESRDGYLGFGHGRRRRPAPPRGDGRRDRRSIAAARDRRALGVGRAQRGRRPRARKPPGSADVGERRRACGTCGRDSLRLPAARRARRRLGASASSTASTSMRTRSRRRPSREIAAPDSSASSTAASSGLRRATRRRTSISPAATPRESRRSSRARTSTRASSPDEVGDASAVKATYAAWTKGSAGAPARDPRGRPPRGRRTRRCSRSGASRSPGLEERLAARRALGAGEGLALGRRDGGDRRDVRGGRRARRLPPRRRRGLSAAYERMF